ncbi:acetyl-CoA synthetase-like protein [Artomyces pyxidatus]|uniref:Acetyl-CoA synthetase-like protein n=1 Tax=Artomyces pyxidatus TaxID=48021 RepID=A0ACB8SGG0_9AGAM|nr:acetyl-CoA synthetase-like protein [Artomyces pyxidatus]
MPYQINTFIRPHLNLGYESASSRGVNSLPELIQFNAHYNPDHVFGLQMRVDATPCKMTFAELHAAIERASAWLVGSGATTGRVSRDQKIAPVAILLGSDIGIFIYMAALLRIGAPVLLLSARLTPVAIAHLLKATSPSTILVNAQVSRSVKETLPLLSDTASAPRFLDALSYEELLRPDHPDLLRLPVPPVYSAYQYGDLDAIIMHSSGTTGLPKPIYHAQAYLLIYAACHRLPEQRDPFSFNVSTLPLYHGFGLLAPSLALSIGMPFVLPPASIIPTARSTLANLESTNARSMLSVPSILEDIVRLPGSAGLQALKKLDFIAIGGAPMKETVGQELVSNGVKLLNHWGATEIGAIAPVQHIPVGYDWHYLIPREDIGLEVTQLDDAGRTYRLIGHAPGWPEPFVVQDLLEVHPHDPKQFKILGRADDLIVLATGEKVRPTNMESTIAEHPDVKAVLAFGDGQFSLGLLVELAVGDRDEQSLLASLEPYLERGNSFMDKHAKIPLDMIVFTRADAKPLSRTDKGSLARKATFSAFDEEIKDCYTRADMSRAVPFPLHTVDDGFALLTAIRNLVISIVELDDLSTFSDDADFFEAGMDSLQASRLRRALLNGLRVTKGLAAPVEDLAPEFVFEHPSVNRIYRTVAQIMSGTYIADAETSKESRRIAAMEEMLERYKQELTRYADTAILAREARARNALRPTASDKRVVLLTGSTGSLGCMLLARLSRDPMVKQVICLNRPQAGGADVHQRQINALKKRGAFVEEEGWQKVVIYEADTSRPDFGLLEEQYAQLLTLTDIIHNAWPVNFNRTLASFEAHVKAVCNLTRLSLLSAAAYPSDVRPRRILFASSIAVVGRYPILHPDGPVAVPEVPLGAAVTAEFGYPEAKWVCERVLEAASELYGAGATDEPLVLTSSVRIGQMTGPEGTGAWNESEHFPIIVRTSQKLRAVPDLDGSLSWMPVNRAAAAITEFLFSKEFHALYHMENPSRQSWSGLLDNLATLLGESEGPLPLIPYPEWLERARALGSDPEKNTAFKVMDFLEHDFLRMASGNVILGTNVAKQVSPTMVKSVALDRRHLAEYITYWRSVAALA